jgi:hypothetical protein
MFFACSGGRGMRRTRMLWEVFVTRFREAFEQYERHRLTSEDPRVENAPAEPLSWIDGCTSRCNDRSY